MAVGKQRERIAMAISGGGFRTALFHLGAFWRINELGYLPKPKLNYSDEIRQVKMEYRDEYAKNTTLTPTDVESLSPRNIDMRRIEQLLKIVNSSVSRNERTAALAKNIETARWRYHAVAQVNP